MEFQGFPRLLSIFYCTFHPTQGPKVLYEVPEGSIMSKNPLVEFDTISEFLIPKVELCSKLVTISTPSCKVLGFPINLEHKKFQRNALMFNLVFVFDKDADLSSYEPVVRKMARVLKALEKECEFLSRQTRQAMMDSGTTTTSAIGTVSSSTQSSPPPASNPTNTSAPSATTGGNSELSSSLSATAAQIVLANQETSQGGASDSNSPSQPTSSSTPAAAGSLSPALSTTSTVVGPSVTASTYPEQQSAETTVTAAASSTHAQEPSGSGAVPSPPTTLQRIGSAPKVPSQTDSSTNEQQQSNDCEGMMSMQNLIEQLLEDLNSYCECQIPVDSANTINLKLFPTYPNPATVYDYQVPIATVNLDTLSDVSWDMTMQRIIGYINGVNSVKRIAEYADVDAALVRMCMEHLLYYGCIIMVDLFQFRNIYACKMEMTRLLEDVALQNECVAYVTLQDMHAPSFAKLYSLYCGLQYGQELHAWIEQNQVANYNIDVRRFISFGVIKGFLYRIHKYPILDVTPSTTTALTIKSAPASSSAQRSPSMSPTIAHAQVPSNTEVMVQKTSEIEQPSSSSQPSKPTIPPQLLALLDGTHHYDELCTMFGCSVRELDQILARDERVKFIYK